MNDDYNSKIETSHNFIDVNLEVFDDVNDSAQNIDPLQQDNNVHMKMEVLQDIKTEICVADSDLNKHMSENLLHTDLGDVAMKTEEIVIKEEYFSNKAGASDDIMESCAITEGKNQNELEELIMDDDSDDLEEIIDPEWLFLDDETAPEEIEIIFRNRPLNVLDFTPPFIGVNKTTAPDINAESTTLSVFNYFFEEVTRILLQETNRYYHQYVAKQNAVETSVPDISFDELYKFFALIIQMGHNQRSNIKDYWSKDMQYYTPFFQNTMSHDRFLHILKFIHFSNNDERLNRKDPNYDKFWKIRKIFDILNNKYAEIYYPTEHLAVVEVGLLFKERTIFRRYIPRKKFEIKIYKLCDSLGYTYDMVVHSGTQNIALTHSTILQLVQRIEGVGHKLYIDNYFSSPLLFDDLLERKIYSCGTVRHYRNDKNYIKLRKGAICWKEKQDLYILTNMHAPSAECNRLNESVNVIEDYNTHMEYAEKSDKMINSYEIVQKSWKWTKKLFFNLLNITILNAYLVHKSVGGKMTHQKFRETLVRDLIMQSNEANVRNGGTNSGRTSCVVRQLSRLEVKHSKHWLSKGNIRRCRVCSVGQKYKRTLYYCEKCDVGLCVVDCFEKWHTRVKL